MKKMTPIPEQDSERQKVRLLDYEVRYFPHAQVAKAVHSYNSNRKHCGSEGMTWASDKSVGDGNQIRRHLLDAMFAWDRGDRKEAEYHLTCLAWRSDELLERFLTGMEPFDAPQPKDELDALPERANAARELTHNGVGEGDASGAWNENHTDKDS